jgi:cytokinesis protein
VNEPITPPEPGAATPQPPEPGLEGAAGPPPPPPPGPPPDVAAYAPASSQASPPPAAFASAPVTPVSPTCAPPPQPLGAPGIAIAGFVCVLVGLFIPFVGIVGLVLS